MSRKSLLAVSVWAIHLEVPSWRLWVIGIVIVWLIWILCVIDNNIVCDWYCYCVSHPPGSFQLKIVCDWYWYCVWFILIIVWATYLEVPSWRLCGIEINSETRRPEKKISSYCNQHPPTLCWVWRQDPVSWIVSSLVTFRTSEGGEVRSKLCGVLMLYIIVR